MDASRTLARQAASLGIEMIDVRLTRVDLPAANSQAVYEGQRRSLAAKRTHELAGTEGYEGLEPHPDQRGRRHHRPVARLEDVER